MSARLLPSGALLDEVAAAIQRHGRPLYALFTTYTFDARLFASQFLPLLCGEYGEDERKVGLLVVCDARMYTGHRLGPWVMTWPGPELFHPKIALLVFRDFTLLMAGSANLTHAGQYQQIEVWGKETWNRCGLPSGLASLIKRLHGSLPRALLDLTRLPSKGFASSLEGSFADRLARGRADEIVIVSPFFDARESAEADDLGFVVDLVRKHRPRAVQLVIPVEPGTIDSRTPRTLIDPRILSGLDGRLRLFGIDPADAARQLHAKLLAVCRHDRARVLFGSANATIAGMDRGNVEAGWFVETTRPDLLGWLRRQGLFARPLDPAAVQQSASAPKPETVARSPLLCARLDEVEAKLTLVWRSSSGAAGTQVTYEGRTLQHRGDVVNGFRLGRDWFVRTRLSGQKRTSCAPIEIERELPGARRAHDAGETSAESLLERLVGAPEVGLPDGVTARRGGSTRRGATAAAEEAPLFERVRRLAAAMAVARGHLEGELPQQLATLALLHRIARAHDPMQKSIDVRTAIWRYWVRAEVARVLSHPPQSRAARQTRRAVLGLLEDRHVPGAVRPTARLVRSGVSR